MWLVGQEAATVGKRVNSASFLENESNLCQSSPDLLNFILNSTHLMPTYKERNRKYILDWMHHQMVSLYIIYVCLHLMSFLGILWTCVIVWLRGAGFYQHCTKVALTHLNSK